MVNDNTQMDMTKTSVRGYLDTDEGTIPNTLAMHSKKTTFTQNQVPSESSQPQGRRENRFSKKNKRRFSSQKLKDTLTNNIQRSVEREREQSPFDHTERRLNIPLGSINTSIHTRNFSLQSNIIDEQNGNKSSREQMADKDNQKMQVSGQVELNQINPNMEDNEIADEEFNSMNIGSMDVKVAEKLELNEEILQRAFEMID